MGLSMTALQREQRAARLRTLKLIGIEVWSPDGITLALRSPVYCHRTIHGNGKQHAWDGSVRSA